MILCQRVRIVAKKCLDTFCRFWTFSDVAPLERRTECVHRQHQDGARPLRERFCQYWCWRIGAQHSFLPMLGNTLSEKMSEGPKGGRRKGGRGRKLSHFSFCCAFRCCVVYSPCFPVWVKKKLWQFMTRAPLPPAPFADSWKCRRVPGNCRWGRKKNKVKFFTAAQDINFNFPPKTWFGTPKALSKEMPENPETSGVPVKEWMHKKGRIQGTPGNSFWGSRTGILGWFCLGGWEQPKLICWARGIYSENTKSCKETGLHYNIWIPHSSERKTVTVNEIFMASKEEQHQSLHYSN